MVIRSETQLRRMLESERNRLQTILTHTGPRGNEHMGYGNHMADDATEAFDQAMDLSVRRSLADTSREIEYALSKFDQGTYGLCESCGVRIDWARLEAKPEARLCIRCQQRSDFGR